MRENDQNCYGDRGRDENLFTRSPYNYNQKPLGPSHHTGFHKAAQEYPGSPEGKEVSGVGGGSRAKIPFFTPFLVNC